MKKSLLIKEQSLESELIILNDSLTKWGNEMQFSEERLKIAQGYQFINPEIKRGEIRIHSCRIQWFQKRISDTKEKMIGIKREADKLNAEILKVDEGD